MGLEKKESIDHDTGISCLFQYVVMGSERSRRSNAPEERWHADFNGFAGLHDEYGLILDELA